MWNNINTHVVKNLIYHESGSTGTGFDFLIENIYVKFKNFDKFESIFFYKK